MLISQYLNLFIIHESRIDNIKLINIILTLLREFLGREIHFVFPSTIDFPVNWVKLKKYF